MGRLCVALQLSVEREARDRVGACHSVSHVGELQRFPFCISACGLGDELLLRLNLTPGVAVAQLHRTERVECGIVSGQHRLAKSLDRLGGRLVIRPRSGMTDPRAARIILSSKRDCATKARCSERSAGESHWFPPVCVAAARRRCRAPVSTGGAVAALPVVHSAVGVTGAPTLGLCPFVSFARATWRWPVLAAGSWLAVPAGWFLYKALPSRTYFAPWSRQRLRRRYCWVPEYGGTGVGATDNSNSLLPRRPDILSTAA